MDERLALKDPGATGSRSRHQRVFGDEFRIGQRGAPMCHGSEATLTVSPQQSKGGSAETRRLFEHRIEDWCEVAWRGVDDLQYLRGSGLVLQRLVALGRALIQLPLLRPSRLRIPRAGVEGPQ